MSDSLFSGQCAYMTRSAMPFKMLGYAIAKQAVVDYRQAISDAIEISNDMKRLKKNKDVISRKEKAAKEMLNLRRWFLNGTFELYTDMPGDITIKKIEDQFPDINIVEFIEGAT